jgi:tetratricopeptide (TPR) repeat protein
VFAYANRGDAYKAQGKYDRAISDYDKAIELDKNNAIAYNGRGNAYKAQGKHDRAISDYDKAIELDKNNAIAYNNRGNAYSDKGEYDSAIADYNKVIELDKNSAFAYNNRGAAYGLKGAYDSAISDYDKAVELDKDYVDAYVGRATAYRAKGQYDRAIADYDKAIDLDKFKVIAYTNRGRTYRAKGEYDRAISDYVKAIELDRNHVSAYIFRGNAYEDLGKHDRAIADYDKAIELNGNSALAYANRGGAYEKKGEYARALADYDRSLSLAPNGASALKGRERVKAALTPAPPPAPKPVIETAAPGQPGKRALVIGIDAYPNLGRPAQLERAVADAEAVGDKLASLGFAVTRLTSELQSTLHALLDGFEEFKKTIEKDDMVVLFYAGHGMSLSGGGTYLVPSDVSEANLKVEAAAKHAAINENELTEGLRQSSAGIIVAVIDACRNDLFTRAFGRDLGDAAPSRGLRPAETAGVYKLYSASDGQVALDRLPAGDTSKNSVFTRVFLSEMGMPGVSLNLLGARVRDKVYELARTADHQQTPAVYDKLIGSTRVYFVPKTAAANRAR